MSGFAMQIAFERGEMRTSRLPDDLNEQSDRLVASGVADKVMHFLHANGYDVSAATLETCSFWAQWTTGHEERGRGFRTPEL